MFSTFLSNSVMQKNYPSLLLQIFINTYKLEKLTRRKQRFLTSITNCNVR